MPNSHESMRGSVLPLKPSEVLQAKAEQLPDEVIEIFNELIARNIYHGTAKVLQKEVVDWLEAMGHERRKIFDSHWLDVEDVYRHAGWKVTYDKPGYNETYEASYEFKDITTITW